MKPNLKHNKIPALTGKQLIKLLKSDGWEIKGCTRHGIAVTKKIGNRIKVAIVPDKTVSLPQGTLMAILGPKQTGLGKAGLQKIIHGR